MRTIALLAVTAALLAAPRPAPTARGMFALYAENRDQGKPNYITEDFLLMTYGMLLDDAIAHFEEKVALPEMAAIVEGLEQELGGGGSADNRAFVAVLRALLAGQDRVSEEKAAAELKLVLAAGGLSKSPLFGQTIDYSQFKPRGKYTRSAELGRYFQAMRYAGTVLFPVRDTQATGTSPADADRLTAQAIGLAKAMQARPGLAKRYEALLGKLTWAFGPSEDLTLEDLLGAPAEGARAHLLALAKKTGRQPRILGGMVDVGKLEPGVTAADALTGWRLFPSRYTPDSAAMQALVFDQVTTYKGKGTPFTGTMANGKIVKGFPRAAELMALLGSTEAARGLGNDTNYEGYAAARQKARQALVTGEGLAGWHVQLMEAWLGGAPGSARRLTTVLGFFTLHRHANVLYAKQSYTPVAKSLAMGGERNAAWIEPAPELYTLLRRLAARTAAEFGYAPMAEFALVLDRAIDIAFDAAAKRSLRPEQMAYLNGLDLELMALTKREDTPIVVDVHTETNSRQVLQEGLAHPWVTEVRGARGALFAHREFKQPMDQRLTDEEWEQKLKAEAKQ
jgi:hypothetical protein